MSAMVDKVSPDRTVYFVGGTGVLGCVGTGVTVGVEVGGGGVCVSVGGGVSVTVGAGIRVGWGTAGARDRKNNPPPASKIAMTPIRSMTSRHENARAGLISGGGASSSTGSVRSTPQMRHVLARTDTLAPQLGQVLG